MFKCKWLAVGVNAYRTSCQPLIAGFYIGGLFNFKYCPHCGKKIKVVEE